MKRVAQLAWLISILWVGAAWGQPPTKPPASPARPATYPALPSEVPARFRPVTDSFDYVKRTAMIRMRDGVRLHTVILVPRRARRAPILLTRTPYSADELTAHSESAHLGPMLQGYDNVTDVIVEGGYIRVVQDVRGKYKSEGDYVMNRPLRGPQNRTPVDHSTDTYDTIEWLVKNTPEANGKVGILGISYDGFLPLMALVDPHPALKVAVPMNPMVDGWIGDDWFHNGAFRLVSLGYIYEQEASRDNVIKWWQTHRDEYERFLMAGSAGQMGKRTGLEQLGFWRKIIAHPNYDAFWRDQAVDKILAGKPLTVPTMLVHGLWDQEDIYGAIAVYKAIEPKDKGNDKVFLVMGPWNHGQQIRDGSNLGAIHFGADTSRQFRQQILRPFLDRYLKDGGARARIAPVMAYETGTNEWRSLPAWPRACASGCAIRSRPYYLRPGSRLSFSPPAAGDAAFTEYVADPAKPVPYRPRPIPPSSHDDGAGWRKWLVEDQRHVSSRPDVVEFVSQPLTAPLKITGEPIANLIASTSGTDADWVVKLIDVYPDEVASQPEMGGYQLMVAADIFRGRFREGFDRPKPVAAGKALRYRFALPTTNHVFQPGHRIMVQVQSSWFPLYDRNPQTFVRDIFWARPSDYRKAVQRLHHAPGQASSVELPVATAR
jgi:putative CocE/NonD family hydrolase